MNALNWFEIPARDIARAQAFYEQLLGCTLRRESMGPGRELAVFPYAEPGVGGCLMQAPGLDPATGPGRGAVLYLPATPTLDGPLQRLAACGGRLVTPKVTLPGDMGAFVHIEDSEGNVVGLHAAA